LKRSADALLLDVPIDIHSADCGAPDSYGHTMTLVLRFAPGTCKIEYAVGEGRPYNDLGPVPAPWRNTFTTTEALDATSQRIELRDAQHQHALLLLPDVYYFYEHVPSGAPLKPELEPENAKGCCYGYMNSKFNPWTASP
jgi:hypothetical protein